MKWLLAAVLMMLGMMGQADVLWWSVTEDIDVVQEGSPNVSLYQFLGNLPWDDWDYWYAAQIVTSRGDILNQYYHGMDENYNKLYYQDNGGLPLTTTENPNYPWIVVDDGLHGTVQLTDIGHPDSPNGVGAEWSMADAPREMLEEVEFQMQIVDANDNVILWSDYVTGKWLMGGDGNPHVHTSNGGLAPPVQIPWIPEKFYTINPYTPPVPEPSTSLLALIGSSLLMLKRKVKV